MGILNAVNSAVAVDRDLRPLFEQGSQSNVSPKQEERKVARVLFGERHGHGQFSPGALRKVMGKALTTSYLESLNLKDAKFSADAFEKYDEAKVKGKDAKATPADEHYKKLNDNPAAGSAKAAVLNALTIDSTAFQTARANYEQSVAKFKDLVKSIPTPYKVRDVLGAMKSIVDDGKESIREQQKKEADNLEVQFKDPEFRKNIKTALNLGSEEAVDLVHKEMAADLKSTHEKQSAAFDKSTQDSLNGLHKAAAKQMNEFLLIKNMHGNSTVMRQLIEDVARENRKKFNLDPESATSMNMPGRDNESVSIDSVSLDQLKFIQTVGGSQITSKKDDKGNVSYSLNFGMRAAPWNILYYATDRYKRDLNIMIQAVRASGSEKITMTINFSNPEIAKLRARETYEACIKNGYDPAKITLVVNGVRMGHQASEKEVNGKKVTIKSIEAELFDGKENKFSQLQEESKSIRKELADVAKGAAIEPTKSSEDAVQTIKNKLMEGKAEQANDANDANDANANKKATEAEQKDAEVEVQLDIAKDADVAVDHDNDEDAGKKMGSSH
ncbi:MAG: hypothetical protein P4L65_06660 [Legionella sp.]|nr:hypothetical protein [Legionella sp.]